MAAPAHAPPIAAISMCAACPSASTGISSFKISASNTPAALFGSPQSTSPRGAISATCAAVVVPLMILQKTRSPRSLFAASTANSSE